MGTNPGWVSNLLDWGIYVTLPAALTIQPMLKKPYAYVPYEETK